MAATPSQTILNHLAIKLKILREHAQSIQNLVGSSFYPTLPIQQPSDYLSWPWIKKLKTFNQYLRMNRETNNAEDHKVDYSPLLWCEQARTDGLNFFCEQNRLIRVQLYAPDGKGLSENSILEPLAPLTVPIELFDQEMLATLEEGITLNVQIGEGCGKEEPTQSTNCIYDRIFGFNKQTWAQYCQTLASNTVIEFPGVTINLTAKHRTNYRELVPDFLIHFAHFRQSGPVHFTEMMSIPFFAALASSMTWTPNEKAFEWHDLLLGLLEEASYKAENESFDAGYNILTRAYQLGQVAMEHTLKYPSVLGTPASLPTHGVFALCIKIFIMFGYTTHIWLQRLITNGEYTFDMISILQLLSKCISSARCWPGMSSKQLAGFHFITGLYNEHLVGFMANPERDAAIRRLYPDVFKYTRFQHIVNAAQHYFAASRVSPAKFAVPAMERWNDIYSRYGLDLPREVFEVKLETISTAAGGEWYGWPNMWQNWPAGSIVFLSAFRAKKVKILSKSQVKKMRERLGVGSCRKEPAGLLRCLAVGAVEVGVLGGEGGGGGAAAAGVGVGVGAGTSGEA